MSSDTQASRPISRRAVVGAAVWATPVIAVVTATPAHAGVSPTQLVGTATRHVDALKISSQAELKTINLDESQISYKADWPGIAEGKKPTVAIVSWRVYVLDAALNEVGTIHSASNVTIAMYGDLKATGKLTGLSAAAGPYTVVSEITSVAYSPNPVDNVLFITVPSSIRQENLSVKDNW